MPLHLPPEEISAWVRLAAEPGLGPVQARQLLQALGLPQHIYAARPAALARLLPLELAQALGAPMSEAAQDLATRTLEWLRHPRHHMVTLADPSYPAALLDTHDPPLLLYVNGRPELLSAPTIAMVGARNASAGGIDNAQAFARHLAAQGWCIASGLAMGIDAASHRGALLAGPQGGGTVAVLGTGIDIIYPSRNHQLAHEIAEHGALVSELPLGTPGLPHQFPRRNRIVAGLARGILVVEAARQSGSLITARLATEIGREVFAIPGSIHSPLSRGCHALIRQGAKLVESAADILEELGPRAATAARAASAPGDVPATGSLPRSAALPLPGMAAESAAADATSHARPDARPPGRPAQTGAQAGTQSANMPAAGGSSPAPRAAEEQRVFEAMGHDPADVDTLQRRTQLPVAALHAALLALELDDAIARLDDGRYQRRQKAYD
ncbi:DNA-processing protein DprA [Candidimonas humi]|uniref:DNA-processing protein DprA n=1 Tax=Candidimonas humi TaxID=683355 RepID=A0ABV8P0I5_9BURK|nr:DNA-processing protein DprA [Candidimonas humi]MBV6306853.1 DNA-processing protein DprA [Candidimonas humi]